MLRQHAAGEWFDFAERHGFKAARAFKPERKTANPAKQVENA